MKLNLRFASTLLCCQTQRHGGQRLAGGVSQDCIECYRQAGRYCRGGGGTYDGRHLYRLSKNVGDGTGKIIFTK